MAALSKFILDSTDRYVEVFRMLKNHKTFEWMAKCAKALKDLKSYLTSPLILSKLEDGEELYIYLAVFGRVVN